MESIPRSASMSMPGSSMSAGKPVLSATTASSASRALVSPGPVGPGSGDSAAIGACQVVTGAGWSAGVGGMSGIIAGLAGALRLSSAGAGPTSGGATMAVSAAARASAGLMGPGLAGPRLAGPRLAGPRLAGPGTDPGLAPARSRRISLARVWVRPRTSSCSVIASTSERTSPRASFPSARSASVTRRSAVWS